jgi:hypothetical protein
MAPTQKSEASLISLVGREELKTFKTGAELKHFFNVINDFSYTSLQTKSTFFLVRPVKGDAISENLAINLR